MKAFFYFVLFFVTISGSNSWGGQTPGQTKNLLVEVINKLSSCPNGSNPCCSITSAAIKDIGPDFYYEFKNTSETACPYIINKSERKKLITHLLKTPPENPTDHFQNIFCGPSQKFQAVKITDPADRRTIGKDISGGCVGGYRIGCGAEGETKPLNLSQTYCSGNFVNIFGKGLSPDQIATNLRTIFPSIDSSKIDSPKNCYVKRIENSQMTGKVTIHHGSTYQLECAEGTTGGGKLKCTNGRLSVDGEGAKTCTKPAGPTGPPRSAEEPKTTCTFGGIEHSDRTSRVEINKGQQIQVTCSDGRVGGGTFKCATDGSLKPLGGAKLQCSEPEPAPTKPEPRPAGPEARIPDRPADPSVDRVDSSPRPKPAAAKPEGEPAVTAKREVTSEPAAPKTGTTTSALSPPSPGQNPCKRSSTGAKTTGPTPALPTVATCNKAHKAFERSMKDLSKHKLGGDSYGDLQKKRKDLERRLALLDDMEHFIKNFNATLSAMIKSKGSIKNALDDFEKTPTMREFQGLSKAIDSILDDRDPNLSQNYAKLGEYLLGSDAVAAKPATDSTPGRPPREATGCKKPDAAENDLCKLLADENVKAVVTNFGKAFQKATECADPDTFNDTNYTREDCRQERDKLLTDFHKALQETNQNVTKLRDLAKTNGDQITEGTAKLTSTIKLSALHSIYGIKNETISKDALNDYFGPDGSESNPGDNSFLKWVGKGVKQRSRLEFESSKNKGKTLEQIQEDLKNPRKAAESFLSDLVKELKSFPKENEKPFCTDLPSCLAKIKSERTASAKIVERRTKIKAELRALKKKEEAFKQDKGFKNKIRFSQQLADYVLFCEKNVKDEKGPRDFLKDVKMCPHGEQEEKVVSYLLSNTGKVISEIDVLINLNRTVDANQLYSISARLTDSCNLGAHGQMKRSSTAASQICSEAGSFTRTVNRSSCQSVRRRAEVASVKAKCSSYRRQGYLCVENPNKPGEIKFTPFHTQGVEGVADMFLTAGEEFFAGVAPAMAMGAYFNNQLIGSMANALGPALKASAVQFAGQTACNSFSAQHFVQSNYQAVLSQNPLMASSLGLSGLVPPSPVGYQPFVPTTFVSAGASSYCAHSFPTGPTASSGVTTFN